MGISLNNHESRIKALETGGSSAWTKGSNSNGNWVKENTTGLIIQFGWSNTPRGDNISVKFPIAFKTSTPVALFTTIGRSTNGNGWFALQQISSRTSTDFKIAHANNDYYSTVSWIAIGYLISDRILNYAYACKSLLFTPLMKWRCE